MEYQTIQTVLLAILTSIITGGFILVFVEIGNRKNRETDRHEMIMLPFMYKLSAYFRFMGFCQGNIVYPKDLNEYEQNFRNLVDWASGHGLTLISRGEGYHIDDFVAGKLEMACLKINNIWYYHDKMNPCNLQWDKHSDLVKDLIYKELREVFPQYISLPLNVDLVAMVSGFFYTDVYQPIKDETYKYEAYFKHYRRQSILVAIAVAFVLVVLTCMLFFSLPIWLMQLVGVMVILFLVMSLLLLAVDVKRQIKVYNQSCKWLDDVRRKYMRFRRIK